MNTAILLKLSTLGHEIMGENIKSIFQTLSLSQFFFNADIKQPNDMLFPNRESSCRACTVYSVPQICSYIPEKGSYYMTINI